MSNKPLVSVIIPTFNEAQTLTEALYSLSKQTYQNLEILVVDDNSSDNTKEIVAGLSKTDPRIRYLLCPHSDPNRVDWRGVNISVGYLARNFGMENSQGEWITFQDADDASILNRIEVQLNLANSYKATCVTTSWVKLNEARLNKQLAVEKFIADNGIAVLTPEEIYNISQKTKGNLMKYATLRRLVPFPVKKWFPFLRSLFFGTQERYPGADNSMFFNRSVIGKVQFRKLSERVWPALSGRGVGRDFVFQIAENFRNSYSFNIPLYLWRQANENSDFPNIDKHLV